MEFDDNELELIMWALRVHYRSGEDSPVGDRIRKLSEKIAPAIHDDPIEYDPEKEDPG